MRRVVVDASALIAGVASKPGNVPALLLAAVEQGAVEAVVCPELIAEVRRGLERPRLRRYLGSPTVDEIVAGIERVGVGFEDPENPEAILRDPTDDYLVALARAGEADAIVTGDKDLLDHDGLEPPAIGIREACERLGVI